MQGTYPVISLSFADIKEADYQTTRYKICQLLVNLFDKYRYLIDNGVLTEYDTPMQAAYVNGFYEELEYFTKSLFISTFKANEWLERGNMIGLTCISRDSFLSDLNHVSVMTITSDRYASCFGFTEQEVFQAMDEAGESSLVSKQIQEGTRGVKKSFEGVLAGEHLYTPIDEEIVYEQLKGDERSVWSLLVASGYLKVVSYEEYGDIPIYQEPKYELMLTNREEQLMFRNMVRGWFREVGDEYNDFIKALLLDDVDGMNIFMNQIALATFSSFDTGKKPSEAANPERFYHGFVLGLMVERRGRYAITSNHESGYGRYDVLLEPLRTELDAVILKYETVLLEKGIPAERIRKYGFAFEGKTVLIGK